MAVLSEGDRAEVWALFMQQERQSVACLKADLRAAVNALDDYMNTNAGAMNTAIPQPARSKLSTTQKALLLQLVISKRYLSGS